MSNRSITVANYAQHARRAVTTTVQPWAEGDYRGEPVVVGGHTAQVERLGPLWPDGSMRTTRLTFPTELAAGEVRRHQVSIEPSAVAPPFAVRPEVTGPWSVGLECDGVAIEWGRPEVLHTGPVAQVARRRGRIPGTQIWAEWLVEIPSGLPMLRWWLHWGASDPTTTALRQEFGEVALVVTGARLVIRHEMAKTMRADYEPTSARVVLDDGPFISDGQSQATQGVLLFWPTERADPVEFSSLEAEALFPVLAISNDWPESKAFGAFGIVPEAPEWLQQPWQQVDATIAKIRREMPRDRDPWGWSRHGCNPNPGDTGAQADFGVCQLWEEARSGIPLRLHWAQFGVYQEACRPTHFREEDVGPVTHQAHPNAMIWSGRPHRVSGDRLGKDRELADWDTRRTGDGRGWMGHDHEHWSVNYLCAYAMLTGDRWAETEVEHQVELWLGAVRTGASAGRWGHLWAARAEGRLLMAGAWLYCVTGREEVLARMVDRVAAVYAGEWAGRNGTDVQPTQVVDWDPRSGLPDPPREQFWMPWQDGFVVAGLEAVLKFSDVLNLRTMILSRLARTLTLFGYYDFGGHGNWVAAKSVAWNDGEPIEPSNYPIQVALYGGYGKWMQQGVLLAETYAVDGTYWGQRARAIISQALSNPRREGWGEGAWFATVERPGVFNV